MRGVHTVSASLSPVAAPLKGHTRPRYRDQGFVIAASVAVGILGIVLATTLHKWPYVIAGVSDGSIYALAALGLVLTYKTSGLFNFAIGAQAAASAYVFYTFRVTEGLPWPLAALLAMLCVGIGGSLLLERIAFLLSDSSATVRVVAVIGLLVLIQSALTGAYGSATLSMKPFLPTSGFTVGGVTIQVGQVILTGLALAATGGLYAFFRQSRLGTAMQAVVDNPTLLMLEATNPVVVRRYAWAIGSCFVSISGMLVAPILGVDVNQMLLLFIAAFGAAGLAAFTSLPVAFMAAVAIGITMNVMSGELSSQSNVVLSELYTQVPFLVLLLALLIVPKGKLMERGVQQLRRAKPVPTFPLPVVVTSSAVALGGSIAIPFVVASAYVDQYTTALGFAVVLASLGILLWTSGQISLCQMAFAALGATTFAHLQHSGLPWLPSLLLAVIVVMLIGAILSLPSFRLSGVYLAVATFGFGLLFQNLLYPTFLMFGAANYQTVSRPAILGINARSDRAYYFVVLVVAIVCAFVVVAVRRSRLGLILRALSDSPVALDAHGASTRLTRLLVFCISAGMAAVGGILIAGVTESAGGALTGPYGYFNSLALLVVLAFCRRLPILSPLLAALVFEVLKVYPPFSGAFFVRYEGVGFGALAIVVAVAPSITGMRVSRRTAERQARTPVSARIEEHQRLGAMA